ncbi:hypothetical protein CEXT_669741 [Caerostris extrusa]|uniref:Uncharacterized protein n=1 Tax=Caerostris extrusa TaxID=172846 RepID=A0AAV4XX27_CAEEX|nr:hypothetical protein CEXT_669741 [Caerostris extrusa]
MMVMKVPGDIINQGFFETFGGGWHEDLGGAQSRGVGTLILIPSPVPVMASGMPASVSSRVVPQRGAVLK